MKTIARVSRTGTLAALLAACVGFGAGCGSGAARAEGPQLGCFPNGEVFDAFTPDAVKIRTTGFLTPFGTLNTNVVLADDPSGPVAVGAVELAERVGELLTAFNTTSSDQIALKASDVPDKYLEQKTMLLCGGPDENPLVRRLVREGKSTVDWTRADMGRIEVIEGAFGGPGTAIILGGADPDAAFYAIGALSEYLKHVGGAGLAQAKMLQADRQLRRGEVAAAADSFEHLLNGLRIDGGATFHAPIKDPSPEFPAELAQEVRMARDVYRLLKRGAPAVEADARFRTLAGRCVYCHDRYLAFDFTGTNRMQYLFAQYPDTRLQTDWARED